MSNSYASWAFGLLVVVLRVLSADAQKIPFTVSDSIEMVHFNEPTRNTANPPDWKISPDGSRVLLVTSRGLVSSDEVESTLWTLDLERVRDYLHSVPRNSAPAPQSIHVARGQVRSFQGDSYGSLITDCRWSADSHFVFSLVEGRGGLKELIKIDVVSKQSKTLSPAGFNVEKYEVDSRGVLYSGYLSSSIVDAFDEGLPEVISSIKGMSLNDLLWPNSRLWPKKVLVRSDSTGIHELAPAPAFCGGQCMSLSPDGKIVIALVPVESTPAEWKAYTPAFPEATLYRPANSELLPVTQYQVIDLSSHTRYPLLDSPAGREAGYVDRPQVVWSPLEDEVLITNTFLPLPSEADKGQKETRPCAVVHVDWRTSRHDCVLRERSAKQHESTNSWAVTAVRFGSTKHSVVVDLSWRGSHTTECYLLSGSTWAQKPIDECGERAGGRSKLTALGIALELVQSFDQPPSLWAFDRNETNRVEIWNPNPQIANRISGQTLLYHWSDQKKREWVGALMLPLGYEPGHRYPLVIQTHGFRQNEYFADGVWSTAMAARPLSSAGFAVLQVSDNREQMGTLQEAEIHVDGYLSAVDHLVHDGMVDPKRVGIVGFSRTCWYVEQSLIEKPDSFAAAVIADGYDASYLQYMLQRPELSTFEPESLYGGIPVGETLQRWINQAPGFQLSKIKTPVRLQALGRFSLLLEWETYASLTIQRKAVDLLYLPKGQHVLQNPAELMASEQGDVDWFRLWLSPHQPAPAHGSKRASVADRAFRGRNVLAGFSIHRVPHHLRHSYAMHF